MMTGLGMGFGIVGLVFMLLFWGGLIALAVWLVKAIFPGNQHSRNTQTDRSSNAREILDQRYARGEITREQYETMKLDIQ